MTVERHTIDGGDDSFTMEDETNFNFETGSTVVEGSQTTMSWQIFENGTDVLVHMTNVTRNNTNKEQRDILQVKKNQTRLLEVDEEQSSGEVDKFEVYDEGGATQSSETNDKLFEAEQLMVVQNSHDPGSNVTNLLFSSGDPGDEILPPNTNEGERNPPDPRQAQERESGDSDNVHSQYEINSPYQPNADLSSYPFLEEIDDQNNDE